jgi:predicted ATPase
MSRFVGRIRDVDALRGYLDRGVRVITVLGPGGMGKTRLAHEVLERFGDCFESGAYFVDLTHATAPADLVALVAEAIGLPPSRGSETEARDNLTRALAAKPGLLLVLDNMEQLLPAAGEVVAGWSSTQILVTSRERLHVADEVVYELGPLPEAVELFMQHAREIDGGFTPSEADLAAIAEITERLERIPLAIELAAARARALKPAELLARLTDRFELLVGGLRDRPLRQATLYQAIEWSWTLLDDGERRAFVAASVFRGGFTVDAFEAVFGEPGALELVQSLRDKSLVRSFGMARGERRLGMYESLREFATTKLEPSYACELYARHARWAIAQRDERVNHEAVLAHALSMPSSELVGLALRAATQLDSGADALTAEQMRSLDAVLALGIEVEPRLLARAQIARATRLSAIARLDEAGVVANEALEIARGVGDIALIGLAEIQLGTARFRAGRNHEALDHARSAIEACRTARDAASEGRALTLEGAALSSLDCGEAALARYDQALSLSRRVGDRRGELHADCGIAFSHLERSFHEPAHHHYTHALELARETGARRMAVLVTGYLALLELDRDRPIDALELASAAVAEANEYGEVRAEGVFSSIAAAARAQLDELALAEQAADAAERLLAPYGMFLEVAHIHRGHVDLARSRSATDREVARRHRADARARVEAANASRLVERSDDARIAVRILTRAIDRLAVPHTPPPDTSVFVGWQGTWFALGTRERVELAKRPTLRALLWLLAGRREAAPGGPVTIDELVAAGWPGQKLVRSVALHRLHVALATLRALGLTEALERRGDGYLLSAKIPLQIRD